MLLDFFVLWVVMSTMPGQVLHYPIQIEYETQEICVKEAERILKELKKVYVGDPALRTYCKPFSRLPKEGRPT